ncbi:hypothetical protein B484DRAFT_445213 [Ochromonadaceae sp. CCMP2298]|nr:hypothetical protein B484DRAFT_445213 [Ochromonadaceae sp. CCMP2298]
MHSGGGVLLNVEVRLQEEFQPSYEWRPLRAWHTIPAGIETRLPLGGDAKKQARIPQPWRLQLPMPPPCEYFLRAEVMRHTTVAELRAQAGRQCHQPAACFWILLDGAPLSPYVTAEAAGLFGGTKRLTFDPSCIRNHSPA